MIKIQKVKNEIKNEMIAIYDNYKRNSATNVNDSNQSIDSTIQYCDQKMLSSKWVEDFKNCNGPKRGKYQFI